MSESSPINWAQEAPRRRTSDAEEPIHGRADCGDPEGVGSGDDNGGVVPEAWDKRADVLSLEGEVRRPGSKRCAAAAATGRREPQAEAASGRASAGHRRIQGGAIKKVVSPQARREAVEVFRVAAECSERHACGQLEVLRAMVRYRRREARFAEANQRLRVLLRELAEERRRWGYRRLHVLL